jgi:23S rRNA (pseudouridine1915-N3)-methyltransferase
VKIRLILIGRKSSAYLDHLDHYTKQINHYIDFSWILLKPSGLSGLQARRKDSANILKAIPKSATVWLLDETGQQLSSPELASKLDNLKNQGQELVLVIGGAYGVNDSLKKRAHFSWSMSKLTLAHEIAWLVTVEQLYRATQISAGTKYHHI